MIPRLKNIYMRLFVWLALIIILILAALVWQGYLQKDNNSISVLSRDGIVTQIQSLSRLETIAYNVDTVVSSEKKGSWIALWQDAQKGLFVVHGQVIAGVDLDKLTRNDVIVSEQDHSISINIPAVEVFKTSIDKIEVYDISGGILNLQPTNKEMIDKLQIEAKRQIQISACKAKILELANQNAQKQITQLFSLTGMQVSVKTQPVTQCR